MITLCIRTDRTEAELFLYDDDKLMAEIKWEAHRQLADTLHTKIAELLQLVDITLSDIDKIGVYEGPGSFTGLRIGMSVANALGYSLAIPTVQAGGDGWIQKCIEVSTQQFSPVYPVYGSDPHITKQKK